MSSEYDQVVRALALQVAQHGRFPPRERFRASQAGRVSAFDELVQWRELYAWDSRNLIVWTVKALTRIGADVEFARQELERAQIVFDELGRMYQESLGRDHSVAELANRVSFSHEDHVRRALMLLQPENIFGDFAIWLGKVEERFQIAGTILTRSTGIFPKFEKSDERVSESHETETLNQRAMRLFLQAFGVPFRERGDLQPHRPTTAKARIVFEFLKERGLLERDGPLYRLSDYGKELALLPTGLASVFELEGSRDAPVEAPGPVEPVASPCISDWERAMHELVDFQDELGALADALFCVLRRSRARHGSPDFDLAIDSEVQALEVALKSGVAEHVATRAIAICEGLAGMDVVVGLLRRHLPGPR